MLLRGKKRDFYFRSSRSIAVKGNSTISDDLSTTDGENKSAKKRNIGLNTQKRKRARKQLKNVINKRKFNEIVFPKRKDSRRIIRSISNQTSVMTKKSRISKLEVNIRNPISSSDDQYAVDIYQYLRIREITNRPIPSYMKHQLCITLLIRNSVLDSISSLAQHFKLDDEVFYLAISYFDRFLSIVYTTRKSKLVVVGFACFLIAVKYEDTLSFPQLQDLTQFTEGICTAQEIINMEKVILEKLSFEMGGPTVCYFLRYICYAMDIPDIVLCLAMYVLEITLLEPDTFLYFLPSKIAASSVYVANCVLRLKPCDASLELWSGYSKKDISSCVMIMHTKYSSFQCSPRALIYEKYKTEKYHRVSEIP